MQASTIATTDAWLVTSHSQVAIRRRRLRQSATVSSIASGSCRRAKILGAFLREAHGGGAAVAPAGPDAARAHDQRDLALQSTGHDEFPAWMHSGTDRSRPPASRKTIDSIQHRSERWGDALQRSVVAAQNKARRNVMPNGMVEARIRPEHHQRGGESVGAHALPMHHRHGCDAVRDRISGAGIDRVGITAATALEIADGVAGGRTANPCSATMTSELVCTPGSSRATHQGDPSGFTPAPRNSPPISTR